MNTPAEHFLDALAVVETWDLPDEESIIQAANQQARLMSGGLNFDEGSNTDYPTAYIDSH